MLVTSVYCFSSWLRSEPAAKFPFQLHIDMRSAGRPFSRGYSTTPKHLITIGPISILPRLTRLAGTVYQ